MLLMMVSNDIVGILDRAETETAIDRPVGHSDR